MQMRSETRRVRTRLIRITLEMTREELQTLIADLTKNQFGKQTEIVCTFMDALKVAVPNPLA